jgi:DNA-binding winged helix-turn-helix (wHTH) protein
MCPVPETIPPESAPILKIGDLQLKPVEQVVLVRNTPIKLTPLEFGVLYTLMNHVGRPLSKDMLVSRVWGYTDSTDASLLKYVIYRLRHKIEPDPKHPCYIQTVPGEGYMFDPSTNRAIQIDDSGVMLKLSYSRQTTIDPRKGTLIALFAVILVLVFGIRTQPRQHCVAEVQSASNVVLSSTLPNSVLCFDTSAEAVEFATSGVVKLDRTATSEEISQILRGYDDGPEQK